MICHLSVCYWAPHQPRQISFFASYYRKRRGYNDSAEHLIVHVAAKVFHQLSVGEFGVGLQKHMGNLCRRTENVPASQTPYRQAYGFYHTLKWKDLMRPAKPTFIETLAAFFQNIKNIKFCKAQSRVNFRNILILVIS